MSARTAPLRLLLATEHTEQDGGAEAVALALAHRRGEPLAAVLPLARDAELEMVAPAAAERADAEAATRREALVARARGTGVAMDLRLRRGPQRHAEILDEARERSAGLLVIRRRGRRGLLANLLVGEMVSQVLAQATCSVLVVPREGQLWRRAVLVAVDPQHREPSLPAAAAVFASECGAALRLVCVALRDDLRPAAEQALAQALGDSGDAAARGEVRVGAVATEIMAAAEACEADLIVVGRHGSGQARARLGSVAREVTGRAACPVLVHAPAPASLPAKGS
ncbi:MAG: universal stress protein [Rubrivivax sp.]|nr:universal stress protein [Rubrivivax sp.]